MSKLQYTFKTDTLFKMLFVQHQDLLKELVAELLGISQESIDQLIIRNPDISSENLGANSAGQDYAALPHTIAVSILDFALFDCREYHSFFQPLEVTRHTLLSDKMGFHFFELPKLPTDVSEGNMLLLWLSCSERRQRKNLKQSERWRCQR